MAKKKPEPMRIRRYCLRDNADISDTEESPYLSFIHNDAVRSVRKWLGNDIIVYVGFPEDLSKWNDFDYVLVLDDAFGQPYTPFYNCFGDTVTDPFPVLRNVINAYNEFMSSLPYLEEILA